MYRRYMCVCMYVWYNGTRTCIIRSHARKHTERYVQPDIHIHTLDIKTER